jgi:murein DD-endopeptidase MepM/ murein hydrolase activator NlpD
MVIDKAGRTRKGLGERNDDFFGWGVSVRAPGRGTVVAAYDQDLDDDLATGKSGFNPERLPKEPLHFYGNYVIFDHGDGEFSLLGHLQHGSLVVKRGDKVAPGQPVARIGTSGSAEFEPHLHYELRRGTTMSVERLPAYFSNFLRLRGGVLVLEKQAPINSGEFVRSRR